MHNESSYIRKADRAEEHISQLTMLLNVFAGKHPYEVTDPIKDAKGKRFSYLRFTEEADPDIALLIGDAIYNLRASFDYLVGSLVPSGQRSRVLCPILREPVWDIPHVAGENSQRMKDRERWDSLTRHIQSVETVEKLKELMPLDSRRKGRKRHPLDLINTGLRRSRLTSVL